MNVHVMWRIILFVCACLMNGVFSQGKYRADAKIAFLFLTRGPMPLEDVWREFFAWNANPDQYSIYIHPHHGFKYPRLVLQMITLNIVYCYHVLIFSLYFCSSKSPHVLKCYTAHHFFMEKK